MARKTPSKTMNGMPSQAVPYTKKTKGWAKRTVDALENACNFESTGVRTSRYRKQINFDLWDGIIHKDDMHLIMNPDDIQDATFDTELQHYPLITTQFNALIGEESTRRIEPQVIVTNPDAVSEKEANMRDYMRDRVVKIIENEEDTDDQKQEKLKRLHKFMRYEYQDAREVRANRILKYLMQELRLHKKWNDGFKNALICAEEIYEIDAFGGTLEFNVLNPKHIYTIMSGESNRIEDADVIIIESYRSPGQLIDRYYDDLTQTQVKDLESKSVVTWSGEKDFIDPQRQVNFFSANMKDDKVDQMVDLTQFVHGGMAFGAPVDPAGNIRELRFLWRSKKKWLRVAYPNPITGEEEVKYMPETYVPNEVLGEEAVVKYGNEWWEATRLADDMDIRVRPKPVQYFRMTNPSLVHPGIVGTVYNTNGGRGVALMDRVKPFQYLGNQLMNQIVDVVRTHMGPLLEVDLSMVPNEWPFEKWIFYAKKLRLAVVDSFNEGQKGLSKGKLAGNTNNTTGKVHNMQLGNYIQQLVMMLEYVETQIRIQTGITPQREGMTKDRETARGIEMAQNASHAVTEPLFLEHEETVLRTTRYLIEAAKHHYRGKKFKAQYFLDDGSLQMFEMDGDEFAEADYDIQTVDGRTVAKLRQQMEQLAHAGLQNEMIDFSTLLDIYMSPSIMDMRRSIEGAEQAKKDADQKRFEMEQETIRQKTQQDAADKQADRDLKWKEAILDSDTEIEKAYIQSEGFSQGKIDNDSDIDKLEEKRDNLLGQMRDLQKKMEIDKEKGRQLEISNAKKTTTAKKKQAASSQS